MELTAVLGMGIVAACLLVLLRQYKPEYALFLSLIASVLVFAAVLRQLLPALDEIQAMLASASVEGTYISVLLKALGICFLVQIATDSCRDAGESAIASRIEMAGRVALVVLALPLFRDILSIALGFLHM